MPSRYDDEFPDSIPPAVWYASPPLEAGPPKKYRDSRLGTLPQEICDRIWECIIGPDCTVPILPSHTGWNAESSRVESWRMWSMLQELADPPE
jgi:hypothetical protein